MTTTQTSKVQVTRSCAGEYEVTDGERVVRISRYFWLSRSGGQWVVRAEWDQHLYTDPLPTLADAKAEALFMLADEA